VISLSSVPVCLAFFRHCHNVLAELVTIRTEKQRALKMDCFAALERLPGEETGIYKLRLDAAGKTFWRLHRCADVSSSRMVAAWPPSFLEHSAKPFLELIAARQREPGLLALEIKLLISQVLGSFSEFPALGRAKIAMRNLLA